MKRFLLFSGNFYYPCGGMNDLLGSFDTKEEALKNAKGDWWHIWDSVTSERIDQIEK